MTSSSPAASGNQVTPPHIVVIGGGFTGAAFVLHLARGSTVPARVTVVEPRDWIGGGVAYSSVDPAHRINVPAVKMSVYSDDETHFDRWVRTNNAVATDPEATLEDGRIFPRRQVFGTYVQSELAAALAGSRIDFRHARDSAVSVRRDGGAWVVGLAGGEAIEADLLVLAASHPPPVPPKIFRDIGPHPRIVLDPWQPNALASIEPNESVLIVGTGLTMVDIVASLDRRGHTGPIRAVSRRGLLPRSHTERPFEPEGEFAIAPPRNARALVRRLRNAISAAAARGIPWQAVLDAVRRDAFSVWTALDTRERSRLIRHLRVFWDVHRYRAAPQVLDVVERRLKDGTLIVRAASVRHVAAGSAKITTTIFHRGKSGGNEETITSDAVILATGPGHGGLFDANGALRTLRAHGHVQPDKLGMGILVDLQSRAIGRNGRHPDLFVAGPLTRGTFGELMGLPQVTQSAERVAAAAVEWLLHRPYIDDRLSALADS